MSYVPHTAAERQAMLAQIGVANIEDLFTVVPAAYRFPEIELPQPV
jgi:glycine dehydrogenase subunit 1